jgi:hypothetical protein
MLRARNFMKRPRNWEAWVCTVLGPLGVSFEDRLDHGRMIRPDRLHTVRLQHLVLEMGVEHTPHLVEQALSFTVS